VHLICLSYSKTSVRRDNATLHKCTIVALGKHKTKQATRERRRLKQNSLPAMQVYTCVHHVGIIPIAAEEAPLDEPPLFLEALNELLLVLPALFRFGACFFFETPLADRLLKPPLEGLGKGLEPDFEVFAGGGILRN
jgi:hypothetical protein